MTWDPSSTGGTRRVQALRIQKRMTLPSWSWAMSGLPVFLDQAITSGTAPGSVASRTTTSPEAISLTIFERYTGRLGHSRPLQSSVRSVAGASISGTHSYAEKLIIRLNFKVIVLFHQVAVPGVNV